MGFGMLAQNLSPNLLEMCSQVAREMDWTSHARNSPVKTFACFGLTQPDFN